MLLNDGRKELELFKYFVNENTFNDCGKTNTITPDMTCKIFHRHVYICVCVCVRSV